MKPLIYDLIKGNVLLQETSQNDSQNTSQDDSQNTSILDNFYLRSETYNAGTDFEYALKLKYLIIKIKLDNIGFTLITILK